MKLFENFGISKERIKERIEWYRTPTWHPWKTYEKNYENRDAPMNIPGPPCACCEYWQPRREYMDIGDPYGKVFDGVTLCVAYDDHGIEMTNDFSCFSPRNEPEDSITTLYRTYHPNGEK